MIERLVFIGSSAFAVPCLQSLHESKDLAPLLVITQPPRPQGRNLRIVHTPVGRYAAEHRISFIHPENVNDDATLGIINDLEPDLLITVSYGGMIGRRLRQAARFGAVNLHPSLLPCLRGATPIQTALLNGMTKTGNTIFKLSSRLDAGAIYRQQTIDINSGENYSSLHDRLSLAGARMMMDFIRTYDPMREVPVPQNDREATYSHKVGKNDLLLDWHEPAIKIMNRIRAFSEEPGAYQIFRGKPLKILRCEIIDDHAQNIPGSIQNFIRNTGWSVNCCDRQILITSVQPAGKAIMSAWAYHIGARLIQGELLMDTAASSS